MSLHNTRSVPFRQAIRDRVLILDVAVLLFVPVVLLSLFFLPTPLRESLAFDYANPSVGSAFTSAFVHLNLAHLVVNVAAYALVVPLTYLLSSVCGYRQRFYASFVTFILVFPVVLTALELLFVRPGIALGFSGVVMAFYGYLPLAMSDFVADRFDIDTQRNVAPLLFFSGIGIITVLGVFPSLDNVTVLLGTAGLVLAILVILLWYTLAILADDIAWRATVASAWRSTGYFELFAISAIVFLTVPFAMFPTDVAVEGAVVDTYTHLTAYSLGFIATYTASSLTTVVPDGYTQSWL